MRIAIVALSIALGVAVPAVAQAGTYQAKNLDACGIQTIEDWHDAPDGTEVPIAGVRLFAGDGQSGRSKTYCITDTSFSSSKGFDPAGSSTIRLSPRMRFNVESLRFIAAPDCRVRAFRGRNFSKRWWNRGDTIGKRDREISEAGDNGFAKVRLRLDCAGAIDK